MQTNSERQRAYRQRRLVDGTDSRLSVIVSAAAAAALARLARHHGQSQRQTLETILSNTEAALVDRLADSRAYFEPVTR